MGNAPPPPVVQKPLPADRRTTSSPRWLAWLLVGLCFGLGYGVTHRLLGLRLGGFWERRPGYGVKAPPGTGLEELRRRSGGPSAPIRADLDRLQKEEAQRREAAEARKRKAEAEERRRQQQQKQDDEALSAPAAPEPEPILAPPPALELPPAREAPPPADVLTPPPAVGNDPPPPPPQP